MTNINILVVDDDRVSQIYLSELIDSVLSNAHVCKVDTGTHALQLMKDNDFEYIFSDILMPGLSGNLLFIELMHAIADKPNCEIVAVSGIANEKSKAEINQIGVKYVLDKPVARDTLVELFGDLAMQKETVDVSIPETCLFPERIIGLYKEKYAKISEILQLYKLTLPDQILKLKNQFENQQAELLVSSAHSVKNSYSYLGHERLRYIAKEIEDGLTSGKTIGEMKPNIAEICNSQNEVMKALETLIDYYENK